MHLVALGVILCSVCDLHCVVIICVCVCVCVCVCLWCGVSAFTMAHIVVQQFEAVYPWHLSEYSGLLLHCLSNKLVETGNPCTKCLNTSPLYLSGTCPNFFSLICTSSAAHTQSYQRLLLWPFRCAIHSKLSFAWTTSWKTTSSMYPLYFCQRPASLNDIMITVYYIDYLQADYYVSWHLTKTSQFCDVLWHHTTHFAL